MAERSLFLSHSLAPESVTRRIQHKLPLKVSSLHAPLSSLSVVSKTSIYFNFLGIVVSKKTKQNKTKNTVSLHHASKNSSTD